MLPELAAFLGFDVLELIEFGGAISGRGGCLRKFSRAVSLMGQAETADRTGKRDIF